MDIKALTGARVFDGEHWHSDAAVLLQANRILKIAPIAEVPRDAQVECLSGGILAPGFIDAQVNGGGGVLLNDAPTSEAMSRIAAAHRRFGTCGLLPTLITTTAPVMEVALRAAEKRSMPGVLGLHLEGPHLDPTRKGVHDQQAMRPMTEADAEVLLAADVGRLLITVAPEQVGADQVARLVAGGVVVSLGHTDAPYSRAEELLDAGATGITHLFNAMSPLENRAPGVVGAALDAGTVWCGVIADGFHVDAATLRIALRAKRPPGRLFLVTDAMSTVGSAMTCFSLDRKVVNLRQGRLTTVDDEGREVLAGSHLDMASAVRFCVVHLELSIDEALRMASLYPAMFLRLDSARGRIRPGFAADLVHLDADLNVMRTWVAGASSQP